MRDDNNGMIKRKNNKRPLYTQVCCQVFCTIILSYHLAATARVCILCKSCLISMPKKTVVSVQLLCTKCKKKVMKLVADLDGVTSIVLDPSKGTATVIGETDPAMIIKRIRKFRKCAELVSVGPPKDEKKETYLTMANSCQRCDAWYILREENHWHCPIL